MTKSIVKCFTNMIGQYCWGLYCGQFGLSFNVGDPSLVINCCKNDPVLDRKVRWRCYPVGKWNFRITHAYWKLIVLSSDGNEQLAATSSSTLKQQNKVCMLITGQKLTSVEINNKNGKTALRFDLGAVLNIRRWEASSNDLWSLSQPNGYFLEVNGDGTYSHVPGSGTDNRPAIHNRPFKKAIIIKGNRK